MTVTVVGNRKQTREEFDRFVEASAGRLVRAAYLLVGDLAEAEDLSQEALAKVALRWPRVRRMESPFGYTRRVLFHLALRERRRRQRDPDSAWLVPEIAVGDRTEAIATQDELAQAIARLSPRQRATLVLRYWEGLSEAEAAAVLDCSVGTVKSQTAKAIQRLRQLLCTPEPTSLAPVNTERILPR